MKRRIENKGQGSGAGRASILNSIGPCTTEGGNGKGQDDGIGKVTIKYFKVKSWWFSVGICKYICIIISVRLWNFKDGGS